jgi:hypothetical protein
MIRIFPIGSYLQRRRAAHHTLQIEAQTLASKKSLQVLRDHAILYSSRLREAELNKEIKRILHICDGLYKENCGGTFTPSQKLSDRLRTLQEKIELLEQQELSALEFMTATQARIRECQEQAHELHTAFQGSLRLAAKQLKNQLEQMREARNFGDASRQRGLAEKRLQSIESEIASALEVERSRDEALRFVSEAESFGPPMTPLWREHLQTLTRNAENFQKSAPCGNYAAAHRALTSCRTLILRVSEDRNSQFELAKDSIWSWIRILNTDPESEATLKALLQSQLNQDFLLEWEKQREKLHQAASERYANVLKRGQDEMRRSMNLRRAPIHTVDVTADPGSPVLRWDELLKFAKCVSQQLGSVHGRARSIEHKVNASLRE